MMMHSRGERISSSSRRARSGVLTTLLASVSIPSCTSNSSAMAIALAMEPIKSSQASGSRLSSCQRHMLSRLRVPVQSVTRPHPSAWQAEAVLARKASPCSRIAGSGWIML